jgi:hypothetical protein
MKKIFGIKEFWCVVVIVLLAMMVQIWGSQKSLDVRLYYTAGEAKSFLNELSPSEISAYVRHECFDLAFIATYSLLLFLWLRRLLPHNKYLLTLAFIPGVLDFIETTTILVILLRAPLEPPSWLGLMTLLKWLSTLGVLFLFILGYFHKPRSRKD